MAGPVWNKQWDRDTRHQYIVLGIGYVARQTGLTQSPAGHPVMVSMTMVPKGSHI